MQIGTACSDRSLNLPFVYGRLTPSPKLASHFVVHDKSDVFISPPRYDHWKVRIEKELNQRLLLGKKLDNTAAKHEAQAVVVVIVTDQLASGSNNIPNTWLDSVIMAIIRKVNNAARTMRVRGGAQSRGVPYQPPPQPATFQQPFLLDP
ncbi:MAG: hypothetical protein M1837_006293 [Sclerophora amabilis]|nr:MAG: hypothetical protein M1837_006293 [Sclerophora amabilis]